MAMARHKRHHTIGVTLTGCNVFGAQANNIINLHRCWPRVIAFLQSDFHILDVVRCKNWSNHFSFLLYVEFCFVCFAYHLHKVCTGTDRTIEQKKNIYNPTCLIHDQCATVSPHFVLLQYAQYLHLHLHVIQHTMHKYFKWTPFSHSMGIVHISNGVKTSLFVHNWLIDFIFHANPI